jgi:hypothetical protein
MPLYVTTESSEDVSACGCVCEDVDGDDGGVESSVAEEED